MDNDAPRRFADRHEDLTLAREGGIAALCGAHSSPDHLRDIAKHWASMCIEDMRGRLLRKGLAVAVALVDYAAEFDEPIDSD